MAFTPVPTISPNDLIRTTWGQAVINDVNLELIRRDGAVAMTGTLTISASPTLALRRTGDAPHLEYQTTGGTLLGYIQYAATTGFVFNSVDTGDEYRFCFGASPTPVLTISNTTMTYSGSFAPTTVKSANIEGVGTVGPQVTIVDSNGATAAASAFLAFHAKGTSSTTYGTMSGFAGYSGGDTLYLRNQLTGGDVRIDATGTGANAIVHADTVTIDSDGSILFNTGAGEVARMAAAAILVGKTTANIGTAGIELGGSGHDGVVWSTTTAAGTRNLYCRHIGSADATGQLYIQFADTDGTQLGSIFQASATDVTYGHGSDYRMKTVIGPIGDAVDRIKALKPYRVTYNGDDARGEVDAFIAHEAADVVPDAVGGVKDAVYPEGHPNAGQPNYQQMEYGKLVPLLTAALQQALATIDDLTARVAALEGVAS